MSTPEDEIKDLKEKNNELVQKVQYWKMAAAQRENEKLELMKEMNDLRLKLARIRSGGAAQARNLDTALQAASEEALSHLVQASGAVARTIELAKTYMRDRQELDNSSPRWSNISGTPKAERVHRVPPMMMGGQSIQPVVSLSRTVLNTSNPRAAPRSPNQNRSITERAVPIHMLQDVYIPLTRIDVNDFPGSNVETDEANIVDNSSDNLILEDSTERSLIDESQNITEDDFEASRRLDAVTEDLEPEDEVFTPTPRSLVENPLEGPSWLLDIPTNTKPSTPRPRRPLEPDSTTELGDGRRTPPRADLYAKGSPGAACAFSPTVRRRKRTSPPPELAPSPAPAPAPAPQPPPPPPPPPARRPSNSGRVLKVLVAKMRLDDSEGSPGRAGAAGGSLGAGAAGAGGAGAAGRAGAAGGAGAAGEGDASPPKRALRATPPQQPKAMRFDAPSPNGATDAGVIVSEALQDDSSFGAGGDSSFGAGGDSRNTSVTSRGGASVTSRDSDHDGASGGRTRRARAPVVYKEKPLNRKMRR